MGMARYAHYIVFDHIAHI
jgi:5'-3' exonuclease